MCLPPRRACTCRTCPDGGVLLPGPQPGDSRHAGADRAATLDTRHRRPGCLPLPAPGQAAWNGSFWPPAFQRERIHTESFAGEADETHCDLARIDGHRRGAAVWLPHLAHKTPSGTTEAGTSGSTSSAGNEPSALPRSPSSGSSGSPSTKITTYTGPVAQTRWGRVQVKISVQGGRLTKVTILQHPSGNSRDAEINNHALPILINESLTAQSATIDMVSGATVTSGGYLTSLQAALDAMFPWQSGSDGRDETPRRLFNSRSQRWMPDNSWRQRHVGLAVAYNAWQYFQATADTRWFAEHGAELIVEVARFFADLATYDERDDRFHIHGTMGPDEYHDGYPDRPGEGLRDNAYTNVLTAWVCQRAVESLAVLPTHERDELSQRIGLRAEEMDGWTRLGSRIAVPFHDGVISQFDGYGDLREFDWPRYRYTYGNIERLDLILESEGDSTNRYRLSKQADVLMLIYLLGPIELVHVLSRLGYPVTTEDLAHTIDYYAARSAHGSTLSRVVHTSVLAMLDRSTAWSEFREALDADLDDTQGGTTGHGIHLGAMAGTVDILLRTFTGMRMQPDALVFRPRPPGALRKVAFELRYRNQRITVTTDRHWLRLSAAPGAGQPVHVAVDDTSVLLGSGQSVRFPIQSPREPLGPSSYADADHVRVLDVDADHGHPAITSRPPATETANDSAADGSSTGPDSASQKSANPR